MGVEDDREAVDFRGLEFTEDVPAGEILQVMMQTYHKTRNPKYLNPIQYFKEKYEYYPTDPVSCEKWLFDKDYFGHVGEAAWPLVQDEFFNIMEANPRPVRAILKGSLGWGKTFLSCLIMARLLYELGCLRYPQLYYGMAPGTTITFMNISVTGGHAKRILFTDMLHMIDQSPWFNSSFIRKKPLEQMLWYPKKSILFFPGTSSELAALGAHLFGGVIEEANFFPVVKYSKRIKNPAEREWDQAKKLHDSIFRRIKSRYQRLGRVPGMLVLNSSANYPQDFLERLSGEPDPTTMTIEHTQWSTMPESRFTGSKFYVFVGDMYSAPKVIKDEKEKAEYEKKGEVVAVPVEYATDFHVDLDGAIRDIMGKNVRATNKFFTNAQRIKDIVDSRIPIPFGTKYKDGVVYDELFASLNYYRMCGPEVNFKKKKVLKAKMHPRAPRFAHIDLGTTGDPCGVCITHVGELEEIRRHDDRGEWITASLPHIYVDLILSIIPPMGGEIQIDQVPTIIYDLTHLLGFQFAKITYDSWQSTSSIQVLRRRYGEDTVGVIRPGKKQGGENYWWVLRDAIYEGRVHSYEYMPLIRELVALERNPVTGEIDHPVDGNDDAAVSLAGAVYNAMEGYDLGVIDEVQKGVLEEQLTLEEKLAKESKDWLMDKKPEKKKEAEEFDEKEWDVDSMSEADIEKELEGDEKE